MLGEDQGTPQLSMSLGVEATSEGGKGWATPHRCRDSIFLLKLEANELH